MNFIKLKKFLPIVMLMFTFSLQAQEIIDQVVAVVGDKIILQSEIEAKYMQYKAQGLTAKQGDLRCKVLEESLVEKLLLNQADLDSIVVSEVEVNGELERRINHFVQQFGSREEMERYYGKKMLEIREEMFDIVKNDITMQRMQGTIVEGIEISPADVRSYYRKLNKDSIPYINAEYELQQIVIYPPNNEASKIEVRDRLLKLRDRILKGESFSTLAVLYSQDPGTARKGGELGYMNKEQLVKEFREAAWSLKKNGVSKIVETEFGYHIIQMIDRKDDMVNCRHILLKPKVAPEDMQTAKLKLDSIANLIKTDSLTFERAALTKSEDEDTRLSGGLLLNQRTGDTKFEVDHIRPEVYYAIRNLKADEMTGVFKSYDDKNKELFKIVKVKAKTEPHQADLTDDFLKIKKMAEGEIKQKVVEKWIREKIKTTFVRIDKSYWDCSFENQGWFK